MKHYRIVVVLLLALASGFAFAAGDPTFHQVYQAAQAGRLNEAQDMMRKVLQDHPNSAKAHYVEAELLARQGHLAAARTELDTAERLAPGLAFAKPQAVQELKTRIAAGRQNPVSLDGARAGSGGFPWAMLLLGVASIGLAFFLFRAMSSRNSPPAANYAPASPAAYPGGVAGPMGQPYPGGMPNAPAGGGLGSGIMSGLATGAAVGAGMVAGEALAHHFMDGNAAGSHPAAPAVDSWGNASNDMGGNDFGIADNSSSWDDSSSVADNMDIGGGDDWS
ncbi:MAG: tetratricopeptide repeat protein [Sulfurimicrobium sp.]